MAREWAVSGFENRTFPPLKLPALSRRVRRRLRFAASGGEDHLGRPWLHQRERSDDQRRDAGDVFVGEIPRRSHRNAAFKAFGKKQHRSQWRSCRQAMFESEDV